MEEWYGVDLYMAKKASQPKKLLGCPQGFMKHETENILSLPKTKSSEGIYFSLNGWGCSKG